MTLPDGLLFKFRSKNKGATIELTRQELITCRRCTCAVDDCTWYKLLDMPIDERSLCCWAEEEEEG